MAYYKVEKSRTLAGTLKRISLLVFILGLAFVFTYGNGNGQFSFAQANLNGSALNRVPKDSYLARTNSIEVQSQGQTLTGSGVVIGIYDGGINLDNPAFKANGVSRVVSQECFGESTEISGCETDPAKLANINCDTTEVGCFHGTAVAGFATGNANVVSINSKQVDVSGVAPGANISYVRQAMSAKGEIKYRDFVKALNKYVADVRDGSLNAPDVINLSLSFPRTSYSNCEVQNEVKDAIDYLTRRGVVVVAASGNDSNKEAVAYPACMSNVVAVGSSGINKIDGTDVVSNFSNMSDEIDIVAPGENQIGLMPANNRYVTVSGTSFAAPIVSGAIALMKQANPNLTTQDVLGLFASNSDVVVDPATQKSYPKLNVQKIFGPQFDALGQKTINGERIDAKEGQLEEGGSYFGFESERTVNSEPVSTINSEIPLDVAVLTGFSVSFLLVVFFSTLILLIIKQRKRKRLAIYNASHEIIDLSRYGNTYSVIDLNDDPDRDDDQILV